MTREISPSMRRFHEAWKKLNPEEKKAYDAEQGYRLQALDAQNARMRNASPALAALYQTEGLRDGERDYDPFGGRNSGMNSQDAANLALAERLQREQGNPGSGPLGGQRSPFKSEYTTPSAEAFLNSRSQPRMLEGGPQQNPFMGEGGFGGYGGRQSGYGGRQGGYGPQQNPFMGGGGFGGFGGYGPQQNPFMGGGGFGGYGPQQNPFMGGGGFGGYGPQQNPFMGGGGFGGYGGQQGGFGPQQNPFMGGSGFGGQQGGFGNQQSSGGQQGGFGQPQQQPISGFGAGQQGGFGNGFGGI